MSPPPTSCFIVADDAGVTCHHDIRRAVFVDEQRLFVGDDRDGRDDSPDTIKVVAVHDGKAAGAVRLFPLDDVDGDRRRWQGDRLAVLAPYRRLGLGIPLVGFAVSTATSLGGEVMTAHIQVANVAFFTHLGWKCDGDVEIYVGVAHQPMAVDLRPES